MTENQENFDNICINSQDSDIELDNKSLLPNNNKHLELNNNELSPHIYYSRHKKLLNGHNIENILIDESSSDSDDVTFIREISKPLLNKVNGKNSKKKRLKSSHKKRWVSLIGGYFIGAIVVSFIIFILLLVVPNNSLNDLWHKMLDKYFHRNANEIIIGCDELSIEDIWVRSVPRLITEGAVRLVNITNDDVFDIVVPFGTNVQKDFICEIYFPGQKRCSGGVIALDGATGEFLWQYDSIGEMYALVCLEDLNQDGWIDCLGAGRQGAFAAISGQDGKELWAFDKQAERNTFMNLYSAQFIDDIDGDGVREILQMHGGDPVAKPSEMNRLIAKLMIFSGKTGHLLVSRIVPDYHESYYSPQILNFGDGVRKILFGTGGETFPGNLFETNLHEFLYSKEKDKLKSNIIYKGLKKGVMTPPVLVDLNKDGRSDIVLCPFGDGCFALDGVTFKEIWKFKPENNSETYCSPAAGFYNDDDVPDIFIQHFVGLGYPVYFYGETKILDGRNGKLLKDLHRSNNLVITSPLTLSFEGYGNDLFLYWLQLCRGHETEINDVPFQNLPQYILSRAHICKVRFNSTTESMFLIHGQHISNKSVTYGQIYNNEKYFHIEHAHSTNSSEQVELFLQKHPSYRNIYEEYLKNLETTNDLSKADLSYATDNNIQHKLLIMDQLEKEKIDLNDNSIHDSIDFTRDDVDDSSTNTNSQNSENERIRLVRSAEEKLRRNKRHNGPHDAEGLMRLISTGTLAPPILSKNDKYYNHSMDIIFATYWSEPKEISLQTQTEIECNKKWANLEYQRFKNDSKFLLYDHDHYSKYGNLYCAKKYGRHEINENDKSEAAMFNNHFGEMTVYRKRLKCTCSPGRVQANQRCSRVLPLHLQAWPAYLGLGGTAYWNSSYFNLKLMKNR